MMMEGTQFFGRAKFGAKKSFQTLSVEYSAGGEEKLGTPGPMLALVPD